MKKHHTNQTAGQSEKCKICGIRIQKSKLRLHLINVHEVAGTFLDADENLIQMDDN